MPTRYLTLTYTCYLTNLPVTARQLDCWVPVPISNERQTIEILKADLSTGKLTTETKYGNHMYYRHINLSQVKSTDTITITLTYKISVDEKAVPEAGTLAPLAKTEASKSMQVYLTGNRLIPLKGPITKLKEQLQLPEQPILAARQIYDYLINTMVYDYKAPGAGRGDVLWACNSHTGDCSDYHSIFIGVCRSAAIPADHVFGLPLKTKLGIGEAKDWHCWARFWVKGPGWITIDASEASKHPELRNYNFGTLSNTFLTLTHGRDVILSPPQKGEPLNIFADPYVEVDGNHFENVKWLASFQEEN
ncbi:MAG: transglutaminase domain-containing protein [Bacteroidota bacterium]